MDSPYWKGPLPGVDVQRRYLWKTFRGKPNSIPGSARKCSASARNPVRLHPGMLFGFSPESCSTCPGMLFGLPRNTQSSSVGVDRPLMLTAKRRCPPCRCSISRRLRARVLLMPPRQPDANDLMIQVSALHPGESPKPRLGIATYLQRHFRFARGRMRIAPGEMVLANPTDFVVHCGDALEVLKTLPSESVNCCITSPPYYGLRDYGVDGQIGLDETPGQYVERLVTD